MEKDINAIDMVRQMVADGQVSQEVAEKYFPELKESEDEKIRKEILTAFSYGHDNSDIYGHGITYGQVRAWLEKQCEKDEEILVLKDQIESLHAARKAMKETYKIELKKQGELKPIDKIQLGKKYKCIASPRYSTFMIGEIYKPEDKFLCSLMNLCSDCFEPIEDGEQKPAETVKWSQQEESCICQLESLVKEQWRQAERVHNSANIKKMSELMFFLTTLNPNKKPQRIISAEAKEAMYDKPEWSKEDEEIIHCLEYTVRHFYEDEDTINRCCGWLKSIRPQNWKPSDEQMRVLDLAIRCGINRGTTEETSLVSLFNDLKKLREE